MESKRNQATKLRLKGFTYPEISARLSIGRSTLSYWFKNLPLGMRAKQRIQKRKNVALVRARDLARKSKLRSRAEQDNILRKQANAIILKAGLRREVQALILTSLYLGEGFKKKSLIGFGNSSPEIIQTFVILLRKVFDVDEQKFRCILYLRADQSSKAEISFWSKTLRISRALFRKTQFDRRTLGKKTYSGYHGVCAVYYYDANIKRIVTALQEEMIRSIRAISSVG